MKTSLTQSTRTDRPIDVITEPNQPTILMNVFNESVSLYPEQEAQLLALLLQRASGVAVGQIGEVSGKDLLRRSARAKIETVLSERFVTSNEQRLARALTHILDSLI